jgi:hypothetical protein
MLSLPGQVAMAQGSDSAKRTVQARQIVAQVGRASGRSAVRRAVEGHEAGLGFSQWIVTDTVMIGTKLTVAADRHVNDVGFDVTAMIVADAPFVEGAGTEILNDHVCARRELEKNPAALVAAQIQREAAFVAVGRGMQKTDPRRFSGQVRRQFAGDFTVDRFHLDHISAQVRQQAAAHRTCPTGGRFEHTNSV